MIAKPLASYTVLTLFPEMITGGLLHSVIRRAVQQGVIEINAVNIRDFSEDKHRRADDYPYGGGCGMVMSPVPVYRAYTSALQSAGTNDVRVLYMTPRGIPFTQQKAHELAEEKNLIIICGHYEGVDERVANLINPEEISLGDFVLTGGELAAMAVIDAAARLVPGVLHNEGSSLDESFSDGLLEYPQYTRPEVFMGLSVPEVLLSGHHANIAEWRHSRAVEITRKRRPDLLMEECKIDSYIFVRPSLEMKGAAMEFREEFVRANSKMNGSAGFLKYETYEEWLADINLIRCGKKEGRTASNVLFAVNRETGEIGGIADIRHKLDPCNPHSYINGHIGGSVRPSLRGKGLGTALLAMSITRALEYGEKRIYVSCDDWNTASERIIIKNGGIYDQSFTEENGNIIKRYYIETFQNAAGSRT